MNYKIAIQLLLSFLIIFLIIHFYNDYLDKKEKNLNLANVTTDNLNDKNVQNNIVKDITFKKIYNTTGDEFVIKAAYGEFIDENNEIIIINDVSAFVYRIDGTVVYIRSDKAKYNTINNNTNFMKNVELAYTDHKINSNFVDIIFSKNLVQAYENLIYQNLEYKLFADKMYLDLATKNINIFMFDNSKVKIKNKN